MDIDLSIIDKGNSLLNVADTVLLTQAAAWDSISTETLTYNFTTGNTYTLNFDNVNGNITAGVDTQLTFTGDASLNTTLPKATMDSGSFTFTPTADVSSIVFDLLGGVLFNGTIEVVGEDVTIVVDDGTTVQTFNGSNQELVTVAEDSTVIITVVAADMFSYECTFLVHTEDLSISIMMIANVTDINDSEYMKPYAHFFVVTDPCSFNVCVYHASSMPFGDWSYKINEVLFLNGRDGCISVCTPGNYEIELTVSTAEISAQCGKVVVPTYDSVDTQTVAVLEYKPEFSITSTWDCCPVLGGVYAISLASLLWNNNVTGCATTNVTYTLYDTGGVQIATQTYAVVQDLDLYTISFSPITLGTYTLKVEVENCCTTTTEEIKLEVCNSWVVTNPECNTLKIENLSGQYELTYVIKELLDSGLFSPIEENVGSTLPPTASTTIEGLKDNLYAITITKKDDITGEVSTLEYIILLDCNLRKCKKALLKEVLCDTGNCNEASINLTKFSVLSSIVYKKWNIWKQQQSIYTTLDINNIVDDIIGLKAALTKLEEFCSECTNDTNLGSNGCGCN